MLLLNFVQIGFAKFVTRIYLSCKVDLSKLIFRFLSVVAWICQGDLWISFSCHMDLSKLIHEFVRVFFKDFKAL